MMETNADTSIINYCVLTSLKYSEIQEKHLIELQAVNADKILHVRPAKTQIQPAHPRSVIRVFACCMQMV